MDIMRTLKERIDFIFFVLFFFFKTTIPPHLGLLYLTGVSRAGLWNVAIIRSFTARHASQLILSEGIGDGDKTNKTNQSRTSHVLKCCITSKTAHLAVPAAQPVAAHGIMGKGTLLTAVGSTACTFLPFKKKWH